MFHSAPTTTSQGRLQMARWVKNVPSVQELQETWVRFLDPKDPLEEETATQLNILVWKNPVHGGAWRATVRGVAKSRTAWAHTTHDTTLWGRGIIATL